MVKKFFEILSMTDNHGDFSISPHLNHGDKISIVKNEETIQPKGFIAIAMTQTSKKRSNFYIINPCISC